MGNTWKEYYKAAYEKARKDNVYLASRLADAEAKQEFLAEKYTRISTNKVFLMMQPRKVCKALLRRMKKGAKSGGGAVDEKLQQQYQEKLAGQADRYGQWLLAQPPMKKRAGSRKLFVFSYQELPALLYGGEQGLAGRGISQRDVLLFAEDKDALVPDATKEISLYFDEHMQCALLYGGEDRCLAGKRTEPWFKPSYSPDTLLSYFYIGSFFALPVVAFLKARERFLFRSFADYERSPYRHALYLFMLHYFQILKSENVYSAESIFYSQPLSDVQEQAKEEDTPDLEYFLHIGETPHHLHKEYWGYEEEYTALKLEFIRSIGLTGRAYETADSSMWTVIPETVKKNKPLVSVVVPTKDHPHLVEKLLSSFVEKTLYKNVEFILVDNGSSIEHKEEILRYLFLLGGYPEDRIRFPGSALEGEGIFNIPPKNGICKQIRYVYKKMEFNFSEMCNMGVAQASGEFVLLLNDDIEVIEENWLDIMVGQAMLPGTGAVGAKLWYPEKQRIQHVGVTNMYIGPCHKLVTFPDISDYYYGKNTLPHNVLAVTAAALLVKKSIFKEVHGLSKDLKVAYNDVDLCFKIAEKGYRNVVRNDAVLVHHESVSRGLDEDSEEKWKRLLSEKRKLYSEHPIYDGKDPYYSVALSGHSPEYGVSFDFPYERVLETVLPEKREGELLDRADKEKLKLTLERCSLQRKHRMEEASIIFAEGWSYVDFVPGSEIERWLILKSIKNKFYYRLPVCDRMRPDVMAILQMQPDIELAGFACRILKEDLKKEKYKVGLLAHSLRTDRYYYAESGKELVID